MSWSKISYKYRDTRKYIIIIILANEIPYIYKAVSTLQVHGEYNLLNLDKGQICRVGEKVGH